MNDACRQLRLDIARTAHRLYELRLVQGTEGNLSARLTGNRTLAGRCLVTPASLAKDAVQPEDMVEIDIASGHMAAGGRNPSGELDLHLAVYRARSDAMAVVHAHPTMTVAVTLARGAFPNDYLSEGLLGLGRVALAPYATPTTPALAASVAPFLVDHDVIVLARHGALAIGHDLDDALRKLEMMEHIAAICYHAFTIGEPEPLSAREVVRLLDMRRTNERLFQGTEKRLEM